MENEETPRERSLRAAAFNFSRNYSKEISTVRCLCPERISELLFCSSTQKIIQFFCRMEQF